ncbi:MAG TPA: hypothetical protein VEA40_15720 [Ramlibacter sp.]|nr:hypothetical protein [Ramlibacter sp.]
MLSHAFASIDSSPRPRAAAPVQDEQAIKVVLAMLGQHMGMDVVFVGEFTEGARRFRVVEALQHGPSAAAATGHADAADATGTLLDVPIVLRSGQVHGRLCCLVQGDTAVQERHLRSLRHGARLAARLLDNEQVLRELQRQSA